MLRGSARGTPLERAPGKGERITLPEVFDEVLERDKRDRERKVSPLVRAADAVAGGQHGNGDRRDCRPICKMLARNAKRKRQRGGRATVKRTLVMLRFPQAARCL